LSSDIYQEFVDYNQGDIKGINQAKFKSAMVSKGFIFKKRKHGNGYIGIKLVKVEIFKDF
jgi:hypothetical protein